MVGIVPLADHATHCRHIVKAAYAFADPLPYTTYRFASPLSPPATISLPVTQCDCSDKYPAL